MIDKTITEDFFALGGDDGKPGRQELTRAELLARVSALIQSCEGCENVSVTGVMPLDRPDEKGCNWGLTLWLKAEGVAPEVYGLAYAQVIGTARESYNLKDEPPPAPAAAPTPSIRIWVDAVGCPAAAKYVLFRAAERRKMMLTLVAEKLPNVPTSAYLRALQAPRGADAAESPIARELAPGDLVVTADTALAAAVIAKGGRALSPRGELYTPENMQAPRATGERAGRPAAMDSAARKRLADALDQLLGKI